MTSAKTNLPYSPLLYFHVAVAMVGRFPPLYLIRTLDFFQFFHRRRHFRFFFFFFARLGSSHRSDFPDYSRFPWLSWALSLIIHTYS